MLCFCVSALCIMMTGTRLTDSVRFTPHGVEDILRTETGTMGEEDSRRDSEDDMVDPLNLSKYHMAETNFAERAFDRETENTCIINTQLETKCRESDPEIISRRKKMRTTFTGRQIFELEKMFETKKYLNSSERSNLSR